jgi:hypothetical protein
MTTGEASTHFKVPVTAEHRAVCLGPDGIAMHVIRVIKMIQGRWKLPILFRLLPIQPCGLLRSSSRCTAASTTQSLRRRGASNEFGQRAGRPRWSRQVRVSSSTSGRPGGNEPPAYVVDNLGNDLRHARTASVDSTCTNGRDRETVVQDGSACSTMHSLGTDP